MKKISIVFRFLAAPNSSWVAEVEADRMAAEHEKEWFYPLLAIVGATSFVQMCYGVELVPALIRGIALFVAFFAAYMICPGLVQAILKKSGSKRVSQNEVKIFTMYNLSIGAFVALVQNLLPAPLIPMYILLLYVLFVLSKCAPLFGITTDDKRMLFVFGTFAVYLFIPLLILLVLLMMIPD